MSTRNPAQRAISPTNTAYSGISNYRTDSYRPLAGEKAPPLPTVDSKTVAKTHFDELQVFLASHLAKEPLNSRSNAREKLTRLTRQQFQELSTDVYDELVRRTTNSAKNEVPFLPVRDDFHPKRNQARQKLATLPKNRFKDLSSDVFFELGRRYPEFKEPEVLPDTPGSTYEDDDNGLSYAAPPPPAKPFYNSTPGKPEPSQLASDTNGYSPAPSRSTPEQSYSSSSGRRPSQEANNYQGSARRPSKDSNTYTIPSGRRPSEDNSVYSSGRKPAEDANGYGSAGRRSEDNSTSYTPTRRPSEDSPSPFQRRPSDGHNRNFSPGPSTATSGMVIPNKSTIAEEEIQVPYGRDDSDPRVSVASGSTVDDRSPLPLAGGLSALGANLGRTNVASPTSDDGAEGLGRGQSEYFDKMSIGRTSIGSSAAGRVPVRRDGRDSFDREEAEKIRREYEFKIATMQNRLLSLENEVSEAYKSRTSDEGRIRTLNDELRRLRERAEDQSATMRAMQEELDDIRATQAEEREREQRRKAEDGEELRRLRERCERLESEKDRLPGNPEAVEELRQDMQQLLDELRDLSSRNDEMMAEKEADETMIRELDAQMKEYKRKYEQAKTELRSVKATSQLFLQAPRTDDHLPVSPDGGIIDVHITAFQSAADSLLTAGRSNAPTRVLNPMKAVVNAVTAIIDDVRTFERKPRRDVDLEAVRSLRERADATLANLVAASKTHATGYGLSPVSLLDAAASHVSTTITELAKLVLIRKATKAEQESFSKINASATNGFAPTLRSVDEARSTERHHRSGSNGSYTRDTDSFAAARRTTSDRSRSSSTASSPPAIFDTPLGTSRTNGTLSDESAVAEVADEAWEELKPYLEAQSETIVYAIQSVLSSVRSPAPAPTLNENLTQIITIVSSIVAVCKGSLPSASVTRGEAILYELSDHCNKLSEVQSLPEITKESRQVMAKSSFAVANAMKDLMKL